MPEMRFLVRWPDGSASSCYSPSLVVKDYLTAGESYGLSDFVERSRTALGIASDRVEAKYGFPCSRAAGQIAAIQAAAERFAGIPDARVTVQSFVE
ncbi:MSMEG_0570 family nitrogen starvation response protein [Azospirillum sp. SYSU D00513]|uniref:MSMEG_0570 family nitrogen starvation response protein n=1 Tax=Azospirillum sp. SYSU D00513 TaxID=2812561 RepID=UPI001A973D48|nr:MSMEG_0570 family nitrogen starvation response protein [Azospirillum sp. SYSU D00513]